MAETTDSKLTNSANNTRAQSNGRPAGGVAIPIIDPMVDNSTVKVRYARSELTKVYIADIDFILVFKDGRKVLLKEAALRSTIEKNYKIGFGDEEVLGSSLFAEAEGVTAATVADALPWGALPTDFADPLAISTSENSASVMVFSTSTLLSIGAAVALAAGGLGGSSSGGAAVSTIPSLTLTAMKGRLWPITWSRSTTSRVIKWGQVRSLRAKWSSS